MSRLPNRNAGCPGGLHPERQEANRAPRLNDVIRLVARLGGFLGRKADGEPGMKTIWLGLQRVTEFAAGLCHAREFGEL